jgi:hypothetical protein
MTSASLSEPGQQEILSAPRSPEQLRREIGRAVQGYLTQRVHHAQMMMAMGGLSRRLVAAGFQSVCETEISFESLPDLDLYMLQAIRSWRHPDCEVPFLASLSVAVTTHGPECGRVTVEVLLADEIKSGGRRGVLTDNAFFAEPVLVTAAELSSSHSWKQWVEKALARLTPETLKGEFDRAMAHLDAMTSP